jgi:hypothetical protein
MCGSGGGRFSPRVPHRPDTDNPSSFIPAVVALGRRRSSTAPCYRRHAGAGAPHPRTRRGSVHGGSLSAFLASRRSVGGPPAPARSGQTIHRLNPGTRRTSGPRELAGGRAASGVQTLLPGRSSGPSGHPWKAGVAERQGPVVGGGGAGVGLKSVGSERERYFTSVALAPCRRAARAKSRSAVRRGMPAERAISETISTSGMRHRAPRE